MSGPELPQPIYPTGAPGPGAGSPPPGPPPPGSPPGPPPAPGGGSAGGPSANKNVLIAAGVAVVLVIVAVAGFALSRNGDDTANPDDTTSVPRNGDGPDTTDEPETTDVPDTEPGGGGGDDDLAERAEQVAELQIIGASGSTVSCLAGEFEGEPDLLAILEDQPAGVRLDRSSDARTYASIVMGCASVDEMIANLSVYLTSIGYDDYSLGCFEAQASTLTTPDWEEFVQMIVQPSRSSELEEVIGALTFC